MDDSESKPLDYAIPQKRERSFQPIIFLGIGVFFVAVILAAIIPAFNHKIDDGSVGKCQSNLHQIGLGILLYCEDHNGNYPDSFQSLLLDQSLASEVFVCPGSNDSPSTAPTTQAQAAELLMPGHLSYVYLGRGLTDKTVLTNQVIAYEPLAHHTDRIHVLLSDGHVEFVDLKRATKILSDANSGIHPVMLKP